MKVCASLLVFTGEAGVLTDKEGQPPTWILDDSPKDSLEVVRTGLYSISGVSPVFYGHIDQAGTFEFFDTEIPEKKIYIVYVIYFPQKFILANEVYIWKNMGELNTSSRLYNIIRYIYGNKQYVQKKSVFENRIPAGRQVSVENKH